MIEYKSHTYAGAGGKPALFARDYPGEGPVLLLMHGLTRNSADFEPLAERLAGRYRLIVPDQRGRGLSADDADPANYRLDIYAQDMFVLLASLGVERVTLVGTSMGGLMAMVMAAMQPDLVNAVVMNDVGPAIDPAGLARIAGYAGKSAGFPGWSQAAERCKEINHTAFPDFDADDWMAFARRTCREHADGTVTFAYDPAIASGFETDDGIVPPDLWPLWQAMGRKPVLLLRGDLSDLLSQDTVARMSELHPGPFEHFDIPNRGHAPLLNEPEALAAIDSFLARHAG